jgi:glycosyltransferase involved in cell wall biosynthesis
MKTQAVRALYSFPLRLGADRICYTAWQQVNGLAAAGADLLVMPASVGRPVDPAVEIAPTLAWGKYRLPYRILGTARSVALHDWITARRLEKLAGKIDIVHAWPTGALQTLKAAARLGIPTVLERPNAHTGFAMEVVRRECDRLGITLPRNHEHAFNAEKLEREQQEYQLATQLLCPSDFVVKTFRDEGFPACRLSRHIYGYDETVYYPSADQRLPESGLRMLFVGVCAVRKGVHFALEAWLKSPASKNGQFLIAGEFLPAYREKLDQMLCHPSVQVLGHRTDVPELMRRSDILVLPSIEEGFGLVITEAMGSGCVPLASEACTEIPGLMRTGLMHAIGDVETLSRQITMLDQNRGLLNEFRAACLASSQLLTWTAAGGRLLDVYRETIAACKAERSRVKSVAGDAGYAHLQAGNDY